MLCENANFPLHMSPRSSTEVKGRDGELLTIGEVDIVLDVYKLLVLAGRMHNCLV